MVLAFRARRPCYLKKEELLKLHAEAVAELSRAGGLERWMSST